MVTKGSAIGIDSHRALLMIFETCNKVPLELGQSGCGRDDGIFLAFTSSLIRREPVREALPPFPEDHPE